MREGDSVNEGRNDSEEKLVCMPYNLKVMPPEFFRLNESSSMSIPSIRNSNWILKLSVFGPGSETANFVKPLM